MDMNTQGRFFSPQLLAQVQSKFQNVDSDPLRPGRRIYFDNAGGAFRLKRAIEAFYAMDSLPDCAERTNATAIYMNKIMAKAEDDIRVIFNAHKGGRIITMLSASQVIFALTGAISENVPGNNIVTTALEHPSAFDACKFYAQKTGKELRVAKPNPQTGGVDIEEIVRLIDKDTTLLSVIFASNISGSVLDIAGIVKAVRAVKPDLHIIVDSVQHAPHGLIDVDALGLDGVNFAPYKFYSVHGFGVGYASERVSKLPHHRLLGKDEETWSLGSPAPGHYHALSEIVDYVCWLGAFEIKSTDRRALYEAGMTSIKLQERALMYHMLEGTEHVPGLRHIAGVKVLLDDPDMTARDFIIAMTIDKWGYTEAVREYERRGIIVYERVNTSIYSRRILDSFGIEGCIRVSPMHCNNTKEIDAFLIATAEMAAK